jgi:acetolactate decarboxylase
MAIDEGFIKALHVETLRRRELHAERSPHLIFQTSTIEALLEGAYDGDVTFAELSGHGDLGLGTLDACDGEMIAVDGAFLRAAVDGSVTPIDPADKTPFAVMTFFDPAQTVSLDAPLDQPALLELMDRYARSDSPCQALRIDGRFDFVRARSVPRQAKPYPTLVEVVRQQHIFELHDFEGTIVGFRFPDYAQGLNVAGYHLHFVTTDRTRGGHVLDCRVRRATLRFDRSSELHLELPPGVELGAPEATDDTRAAVQSVEHDG